MNFESKYYILHSTVTNPSQVMHTELMAINRTKTTIAGIPDLCVSRDPEFSSVVMFGEGKTRSDMDSGAHPYFFSELLRAVLQPVELTRAFSRSCRQLSCRYSSVIEHNLHYCGLDLTRDNFL